MNLLSFSLVGLSYLSQKYEVNNPISNEGFEKTEIPNSLDRKSNGKSFNSIMNDTSHQGLTEEVKRSKNESFDAMKIRIVYEEMQLRYLRLEKKYRNLDKQYRTQKQVSRIVLWKSWFVIRNLLTCVLCSMIFNDAELDRMMMMMIADNCDDDD